MSPPSRSESPPLQRQEERISGIRQFSKVVVRLWLIRHGESVANASGIIAGQQDSPLTELGYQQARALGRSSWFSHPVLDPPPPIDPTTSDSLPVRPPHGWWRCYSSDLSRALETARTVLDEARQSSQISGPDLPRLDDIRVDKRLRERAYGARELCRRGMPYSECVDLWMSKANPNGVAGSTHRGSRQDPTRIERTVNSPQTEGLLEGVIPPLETEDDVCRRAESFLREVLAEAATAPAAESTNEQSDETTERNILVVAHAGFIRQILRHLVGDAGLRKHPNAESAFEEATNRFLIPNTSLSVIRVWVVGDEDSAGAHRTPADRERSDSGRGLAVGLPISRVDLQQLNWVEHLTSRTFIPIDEAKNKS